MILPFIVAIVIQAANAGSSTCDFQLVHLQDDTKITNEGVLDQVSTSFQNLKLRHSGAVFGVAEVSPGSGECFSVLSGLASDVSAAVTSLISIKSSTGTSDQVTDVGTGIIGGLIDHSVGWSADHGHRIITVLTESEPMFWEDTEDFQKVERDFLGVPVIRGESDYRDLNCANTYPSLPVLAGLLSGTNTTLILMVDKSVKSKWDDALSAQNKDLFRVLSVDSNNPAAKKRHSSLVI